MNVAVIGLGSMGKRRIRLSRKIDPTIEIIGIDSNSDRAAEVACDYGIQTVKTLDEAFALEPDCLIICTSPLSHAALIKQALTCNVPVFTELNLVSTGYERFVAEEADRKMFLSSTSCIAEM